MSEKLEAFVVTEQLSGREVKTRISQKTGKEWYVVNYPELREKDIYTNVSFNSHIMTLSMPKYEGSKLKHVIDNQLFNFKHKAVIKGDKHEFTTKTGRLLSRDFDAISLLFINEDDVVDCWNHIFELLFKEDYLEMSVRFLEEAVSKLKVEGKNW